MGRVRVTTIRAIDILLVCTGNMCRSPMAEALLRHQVDERGIPARIGSAGLTGDGSPASAPALQVMEVEFGKPIDAHRSRLLTKELIEGSDLVIGLAREHVRETALLDPSAYARTFTLKELVRRGNDVGGRAADEPFDAWLARLHEGRSPRMHFGSSPDDDVEDPIGRRPAVYERVADELDDLIDQFVELAWGVDQSVPDKNELAAT
jgi:protein-tyrosine phosphatase